MTDAMTEARPVALEIPLSELPEKTKDFLLAAGVAGGKCVSSVVCETLEVAASRAGFTDGPQTNTAAA